MRHAWVAVALVVLAVLVGVLWVAYGLPAALVGGGSSEHPGAEPPLGTNPTLRGAASSAPDAKTPAPDPTSTPIDPAAPDEPVIEGTLVIREVDGTEVPAHGYRLELLVVGERYVGKAEVANGAWAIDHARGSRVKVWGLSGGRRAIMLSSAQRERVFDTTEPLRLVARPVPPTRLHVQDADTGAELTDVRVLFAEDWEYSEIGHPGETEVTRVLAEAAPSPLDLAPPFEDGYWPEEEPLLVHSPGYGWGRIDLDYRVGGTRIVKLEPGGELAARLSGPEPPRMARLRIRKRAARELWQVFVAYGVTGRRELRIADLPPGAYRMQVEVGEPERSAIVLARASFEIRRGRTTTARLELRPFVRPKPVRLGGELHVPAAWEIDAPVLIFEIIGDILLGQRKRRYFNVGRDLHPDPRRPNVWRFDAGEVQPGRYQVIESQSGYRQGLGVGPDSGDVRIVVTPPVDLTLRVVEDATGRDAPIQAISWHMQLPKGVSMVGPVGIDRSPETKMFHFRVPAGRIDVSAGSEDFEAGHKVLDVTPDKTEHVIRVKPPTIVHVVARRGEQTLETVRIEATRLDERGESMNWVGGPRVNLLRPGRYRVRLLPPADFEPPAPREVTVREGETVRLEFELRPKR